MTGKFEKTQESPQKYNLNSKESNFPNKTSQNSNDSKITKILNKKDRTYDTLLELYEALNDQSILSTLNTLNSTIDGSILHYLAQTAQASEDTSWRMVYLLSNAGIDVNMKNSKGNTALHIAYMRGYTEIGFHFIEALLKVGTDLEIKNNNNKTAISYMEDIEQLNCMYLSHSPSIWYAVENSLVEDVTRLMNAWIKVDCKRENISLIKYAEDICDNNQEIIKILQEYKSPNNFAHSVFALDTKRMEILKEEMKNSFNPDMADYCYCFSWFRPMYRNLPKFLFEAALDSKNVSVVEKILSFGSDVNLLHTEYGIPFYYFAFEPWLKSIKASLLKNANFNIRNYQGQNILFHLVHLYSHSHNMSNSKYLLEDFSSILKNSPMLIVQRDQDDLTLIETILTSSQSIYSKTADFLAEISNFTLNIINSKNLSLIQEMVFHSYGLVLLNTPIIIQNEKNSKSKKNLTLEEYLNESNLKSVKNHIRNLIDIESINMIKQFHRAIKLGDIDTIQKIIQIDKRKFITKIKDYSGRSCLHISVLFSQVSISNRAEILCEYILDNFLNESPNLKNYFKRVFQCVRIFSKRKYFYWHDPNLINTTDNLNRTCLHYAYALKDKKIINLLITNGINENERDSKYFLAEEFENEEVRSDEWFRVKNFKENESKYSNGFYHYTRCFVYKNIRKAIEDHDLEKLEKTSENLKRNGLSYKDVQFWKSENCWLEGKQYIPPLDLAFEFKNYSAFRHILENSIELRQNSLHPTRALEKNLGSCVSSGRLRSAHLTPEKSFDLYLLNLREKAEEKEMDEIIDILDNLDDDIEITAALRLSSAKSFLNVEKNEIKNFKSNKNAPILSNLIKEARSVKSTSNQNKDTSDVQNNLNNSRRLNESFNANTNISKETSKLCSIL